MDPQPKRPHASVRRIDGYTVQKWGRLVVILLPNTETKVVENLFLPFKTPLCSFYDDQIDKEHRFHPEDVFSAPILNGRKIGLWCDFTKTDRFYFKSEVTANIFSDIAYFLIGRIS